MFSNPQKTILAPGADKRDDAASAEKSMRAAACQVT
jgi:hypothetical protein